MDVGIVRFDFEKKGCKVSTWTFIFSSMMRSSLLFLFIGSAIVSWAQLPVIEKPATTGPGTGLGASVHINDVDSIYSKILQYNYQYMSLSELESIEMRLDDLVFWEFHMGWVWGRMSLE